MLAILNCALMPKSGIFGHISKLFYKKSCLAIRNDKILGAPVLHIVLEIEQDISPRVLNRQLSKVRRILSCHGRINVCFTHNFPYAGYFLQKGFEQPDLTRLYEAIAPQAAGKIICEGGTAYFSAVRLSNTGVGTISALCGKCRHFLADVAYGGEEYFGEIQRQLGISVVENPTPEQFLAANAAVFMGSVRDSVVLNDECVVFAINEPALKGVRFNRLVTGLNVTLPQDKDGEICQKFPRQAIIANALNNMTLTAGEVTLQSLTVSQTEVFRLDKARFV